MRIEFQLLARVALLGTAAAGIGLARTDPSAPASRPSGATMPAAPRYPSAALVDACRKRADAISEKLDRSFKVVVRPPFVVAGNMPPDRLQLMVRGSVVKPAQAMWAAYFTARPDKAITVLLFADDKSYRTWAERLYGDGRLPHFGYYKPTERTLVMNIATGTGTLVHELTHALIVYDFPDVPTWFNEGLASLHEQCQVARKDIIGLTNWRLRGLQETIKAGRLRPLRDLVTKRDFYGRRQGVNYAQARYFVMYMQRRGLLKKFYVHFRKHHTGPNADAKAVEHVFGKSVEQIEPEFTAWVKTLRFGARRGR